MSEWSSFNLGEKILAGFVVACGVVGLVALYAVLLAFPVKWLWNWLCPDIFGLTAITFWQALGLLLLTGLLVRKGSSK